ncbi:hypothetical protein GCM10020219_009670 [Nonomuraea dietziae]
MLPPRDGGTIEVDPHDLHAVREPPSAGGTRAFETVGEPEGGGQGGGEDAERTQVFGEWGRPDAGEQPSYTVPGSTPSYPGWSAAEEPRQADSPSPPTPSRYDPPTPSGESPPYEGSHAAPAAQGGEDTPDSSVPGVSPSSPYGGAPGTGSTPYGGEQGGSHRASQESTYGDPQAGGPYGGSQPGGSPYGGPQSGPQPGASPYGGAQSGPQQGTGPYGPASQGGAYGGGAHAADAPGGQPSHEIPSPYGPAAGGAVYTPPPGGAQRYQGGPDWRPAQAGSGLATTSLVLGIASLFLLFVCFTGVLTAIVGLVLGLVAVSKGASKGRAWTGVALSALTLILAVGAAVWISNYFAECSGLPPRLSEACVESKIPWMDRGPN